MTETVTRKKGYMPTDEDYHIQRISIDEAENGVVIRCGYALNDDVKEKMKAQEKNDGIYMSTYCDDETHVFESKADAKKFIIGELDALWADNVADEEAGY